jgi:hypothetical protein
VLLRFAIVLVTLSDVVDDVGDRGVATEVEGEDSVLSMPYRRWILSTWPRLGRGGERV